MSSDEYEFHETFGGFDGEDSAPPPGAGWELKETVKVPRGSGKTITVYRWQRPAQAKAPAPVMCPHCGYERHSEACQRAHP